MALYLNGKLVDKGQVYADSIPMSVADNTTIADALDEKVDTSDFSADNMPIQSGSAVNTKEYIDTIKLKVFFLNDTLLNVLGGTLRGFGSATITLSDGIARIDFNLKITVAETNSGINTWGINRDYFTTLTGKTISPQAGGTAIYFDASGNVLDSRTDLGGSFLVNGQFWQPARVYDDNGTRKVGGWASSTFAVGQRLSGTVYGTFT